MVSTWREAEAGKEKLAGDRLKYVGIDALKPPVAATRGVLSLTEKPGTRGMVNPRTIAALEGQCKQ